MFNNKGFSIIELLVVIGIIALFSALILPNYRSGDRQLALQRSAHKLAQDLRRVQEMAVSAKEFEGTVPEGGYGIEFKSTPSPPYEKEYILFGDQNSNHSYDGSDFLIEILEPEKGVFIKNPIETEKGDKNTVSVTFVSPDPQIYIVPPLGQAPEWVRITLALEQDPAKTKTIFVNKVGLIAIE